MKRMANRTGFYAKDNLTGRLRRNLWGGKSAGHDYIQVLLQLLHKQAWKPSKIDPCMFGKDRAEETILLTITVDGFLVVSYKQTAIDLLHTPSHRNIK